MVLKAFVISLDSKNETAVSLVKHLQQSNIDTTIFPAVDGRKGIPSLQPDEQLDQSKSLTQRRRKLTSSEVGCYLSHLRAIKQALELGATHVAIFEDDVVAEEPLTSLLKELVELPDSFELVRLMELKPAKRKVIRALSNDHLLTRPLRGTLGTQGYLLNRQGMKKVIDYGSKICMPIDKLYDNFFMFGLRTYCIEPHLIHETLAASNVSKSEPLVRTLSVNLKWQLFKLTRSVRRRLYFICHLTEFYPAQKSINKPGKSQRIR